MIKNSLKIATITLFTYLGGCGEETALPVNSVSTIQSETESFTIRNPEIKQDIINALIDSDIQHWTNEDGSIGFYSQDAERVDAIGYAAIGAYAARN
tara:strand:- start:134 stop:424 length:291 start_codon:yes stop_codon:yes gene_type:complete